MQIVTSNQLTLSGFGADAFFRFPRSNFGFTLFSFFAFASRYFFHLFFSVCKWRLAIGDWRHKAQTAIILQQRRQREQRSTPLTSRHFCFNSENINQRTAKEAFHFIPYTLSRLTFYTELVQRGFEIYINSITKRYHRPPILHIALYLKQQ